MVVPYRLRISEVQRRVEESTPWCFMSLLFTVRDNWFIVRTHLPDAVQDMIDDLERRAHRTEGHQDDREDDLDAEPDDDMHIYRRRFGGRTPRPEPGDPRQAVTLFATQKACSVMPLASPQSISLIMRAEFKTASAMMNSRSSLQTKQCMQAAFKRNGIPIPTSPLTTHTGPTSSCGMFFNEEHTLGLMQTMTQQTELMKQLYDLQMSTAMTSDVQRVNQGLREVIAKQDQTMEIVKNAFTERRHASKA